MNTIPISIVTIKYIHFGKGTIDMLNVYDTTPQQNHGLRMLYHKNTIHPWYSLIRNHRLAIYLCYIFTRKP